MNILDQLAEYSRLRVAEDKKKISLEEMKNIAIQTKNEKLCDFAFEKALKKELRRSGMVLEDPAVLQAMEHSALESPCYLPIAVLSLIHI